MIHEENMGTLLAQLLAYPCGDYGGRLEEAIDAVGRQVPQASDELARFAAAVGPLSPEEHEELFTQTFDVNPAAALEIGWHLFGEDYHRGALLVRLRQELRRHGLAESEELPDHLTHVLRLVDRMGQDEAESFVQACVLPAIERVLEGFRGKENPYEHLLDCVAVILRTRFGGNH